MPTTAVRSVKSTATTSRPRHRKAPRQRDGASSLFHASPYPRIARIHAALQHGGRVTTESLAGELEVSSRTIKRDIDLMRDGMGMPIEWDPGERSFVYTRTCETLPLLRLDAQEALALALAGHAFDRSHGSSLGRVLASMLKKIAPVFGSAVSVAVASVDEVLSPADAGSEREIEHLLPLVQAIARRQVLAIDYAKPGRSPETRTIHPLHLAELDDGWLLLAQYPGSRDVRTFVLRRIHALKATDATFQFPADFDAKAILRGSLGRFTGKKEYDVRLALDADAAHYARERSWHHSQKLSALPDGRVELALRVNNLIDIQNRVLRWGAHVEVLSPPELRHAVRASLQAALDRYAE